MSTDILVSVALCKCTVNPVPGVLDIRVLLLPLGFLLPALVLIVLQPSIHVLVPDCTSCLKIALKSN